MNQKRLPLWTIDIYRSIFPISNKLSIRSRRQRETQIFIFEKRVFEEEAFRAISIQQWRLLLLLLLLRLPVPVSLVPFPPPSLKVLLISFSPLLRVCAFMVKLSLVTGSVLMNGNQSLLYVQLDSLIPLMEAIIFAKQCLFVQF